MSTRSRGSKTSAKATAEKAGDVQIVEPAYSHAENAFFHEVVAIGYNFLHGKNLSKAQVAATLKRAQGVFLASGKQVLRIKPDPDSALNTENDG